LFSDAVKPVIAPDAQGGMEVQLTRLFGKPIPPRT
jgi:hypothetical protein